jgi:hypothetical protein
VNDISKALGDIKVHEDVQDTLERTKHYLAEAGVDLDKTKLTLGQHLRVDGDREDPSSTTPPRMLLLTWCREYRAPLVLRVSAGQGTLQPLKFLLHGPYQRCQPTSGEGTGDSQCEGCQAEGHILIAIFCHRCHRGVDHHFNRSIGRIVSANHLLDEPSAPQRHWRGEKKAHRLLLPLCNKDAATFEKSQRFGLHEKMQLGHSAAGQPLCDTGFEQWIPSRTLTIPFNDGDAFVSCAMSLGAKGRVAIERGVPTCRLPHRLSADLDRGIPTSLYRRGSRPLLGVEVTDASSGAGRDLFKLLHRLNQSFRGANGHSRTDSNLAVVNVSGNRVAVRRQEMRDAGIQDLMRG